MRCAQDNLDFLATYGRQEPFVLSANNSVNMVTQSRDWNQIIDCMHKIAKKDDIPLTWVPDRQKWTVDPRDGDFLANACWDLEHAKTRLLSNAEDCAGAALHVGTRRSRSELQSNAASCMAQAAAIDFTLGSLTTERDRVRTIEATNGLID